MRTSSCSWFRFAFLLSLALAFSSQGFSQDKQEEQPDDKQKENQQDDDGKKEPENGNNEQRNRFFSRFNRSTAKYQKGHAKLAFREVVKQAAESTVAVLGKGKQIALGAVVGADGYVLTKASELKGDELECRLGDGRLYEATIIGVHEATDLAMLKIEAEELSEIDWRDTSAPDVGSWLVTSSPGEDPISFGVVSVKPRKIPPAAGLLGVFLEDSGENKGARINQVMPKSAAEDAGIRVNDVVVEVDGRAVKKREDLINYVRGKPAGTTVKIKVKRGDDELELAATLGDRDRAPDNNRSNFQNNLGGSLSGRRRNFESVLQHDTVLAPNQCGGPILDLDGLAVGINIARAGRVESYALPISVIRPLLADLKAGNYSPAVIRLAELNRTLDNLRKNEASLAKQMDSLQKALEQARQAQQAAKKSAEAAAEALKKADEQLASSTKAAEEAAQELKASRELLKELSEEKASLEQKQEKE